MGTNVVGSMSIPAPDPDAYRSYHHHGVTEARTATGVHGLGRRPSKADLTPIDPAALAEFNAGTDRAVEANRNRLTREKFLDSLYIYNERAR